MELANVIKKYRDLNNWSQEELANILKVSRQSVSKWESGKNYPSLDILIVMSDLFDVTLDQLVKGDIELKRQILDGDYHSGIHRGNRPTTIAGFLADYWWIIFPVGVF
ncbi:transcriptional regulator [Staphylococcus succinus]|nr:transcriptional regulator [Staphylococcus succinus]